MYILSHFIIYEKDSSSQLHLLEQLPLSLCTYPFFFFNFCFRKTGFGSGLPIFINSGVSLNLKVVTQQVSIPRLNPIKSVASTNFAISPFPFFKLGSSLWCPSSFLSFLLEPPNSLDTDSSYLEKVLSLIYYLSFFYRRLLCWSNQI